MFVGNTILGLAHTKPEFIYKSPILTSPSDLPVTIPHKQPCCPTECSHLSLNQEVSIGIGLKVPKGEATKARKAAALDRALALPLTRAALVPRKQLTSDVIKLHERTTTILKLLQSRCFHSQISAVREHCQNRRANNRKRVKRENGSYQCLCCLWEAHGRLKVEVNSLNPNKTWMFNQKFSLHLLFASKQRK